MSTHRFNSGDRITYKNPDSPTSPRYTGTFVTRRYSPTDPWHQVTLDEFPEGEHFILPESGMRPYHLTVEEWADYLGIQFVKVLDPSDEQKLTYEEFQKLTGGWAQFIDLPPLTLEQQAKHYEVREREIVEHLIRNYEEKIEEWLSIYPNASGVEGAFDSGYLTGLRTAIIELRRLLAKMSNSQPTTVGPTYASFAAEP